MLWKNDNYVKVWKIENKGKYFQGRISSSNKQQDGTYKNSNWNVRFVGKGTAMAEDIKEGDSLKITNWAVENLWDKENQKEWLRVIVFGWEFANRDSESFVAVDDDDDSLPF
jgi:hypothetical protein